ncbi:hypothetical protein HZS61_003921 [Fusarium oxysporum f. sp. conglutinans]|uniref:Uncharacterized protein n=1 Tax=Fusarium oxysporum f. sp. conglutinans TaxID=100902 RepID=A0A8H6GEM8_FUSOX|nr:hypothetical protein HZS61_003921 [Fusarium oxysporum f. sp. conglutinans]
MSVPTPYRIPSQGPPAENPAKHLQTRGTEGEPFYLVLARVTVTVPVTAIVIQESKGEFLIHISPPSLSLPQTGRTREDLGKTCRSRACSHVSDQVSQETAHTRPCGILSCIAHPSGGFVRVWVVQASRHIYVCLVWG